MPTISFAWPNVAFHVQLHPSVVFANYSLNLFKSDFQVKSDFTPIMSALRLASVCRLALTPRLASVPLKRGIATTQVCSKKNGGLDAGRWTKDAGRWNYVPDPMEHAVGIERFEMQAKAAGIEDLWDLEVQKLGEGTRENPDLVPSMYNKRIVGHLCEEGQTYMTYFYLYKGHPKRCQCGHWFKLTEAEPYHF